MTAEAIHSCDERPENRQLIDTAVEAMRDELAFMGPAGVPLTRLLEVGVASVPETGEPRNVLLRLVDTPNLFFSSPLPAWALPLWPELLCRAGDRIRVEMGPRTIFAHIADSAPMLTYPVANECRAFDTPHWMPALAFWE